jgi:O-antigen/teichoic acid export membrane protein
MTSERLGHVPAEPFPPVELGGVDEPSPAGPASHHPEVLPVGGFRRLLGSSAWLLGANAVVLGLGFLQMILATRILGPQAYGLLALIITYAGAVGQVIDSRVWETATSYLVRYRADGDLVKAAAMAKLCYLIDGSTALLALVVVAASSPWVARGLLRDAGLAGLLVAFAITLVASAPTGTSSVLLRVGGHFPALALQNALTGTIRFAAVSTALLVAGTVESVVWAYVAATGIGAAVTLGMGARGARALGLGGLRGIMRAPLASLGADRRGITRFLMVSNASGTLKLVQRFGDVLLVGYVLGPAQAGFVKLARSFGDLINVPVAPVYEASYPTFAAHWRHRRIRELRALARRVTLSSGLLGAIGASVLLVAAEPIVRLTAGDQFAPAAVPLRLFAIAMGLAVSTSAWHPLLVAVDRPGRSLVAMATGTVVQLTILLSTLTALGIAAAGLASIGFYLAWIFMVGRALMEVSKSG